MNYEFASISQNRKNSEGIISFKKWQLNGDDMPSRRMRHYILLSCPGDVVGLMPTVFDALDEFNKRYGDSHLIDLHGRHWSRDMYPKSGGKPQGLINEIVVPNCDAAIAIFWYNHGHPMEKYEFGAVEEIDRATYGTANPLFIAWSNYSSM